MSVPSRTVSAFFPFAAVLALAACSQTAESPQDQSTLRLDDAPAESEPRPKEERGEAAAPAPVIAERTPQPPVQKIPAVRAPEQDPSLPTYVRHGARKELE